MGIFMCFLIPIACLFGCGGFVFWVWMLVDCAKNESSEGNDKIVWILIIALANLPGAIIYFIVRRPTRKAKFGK